MKDLHYQETIDSPRMDCSEMGIEAKGGGPCGIGHGVAAQVHRTPVIATRCNENLHKILKDKIHHLPNMFLAMAQDAADKDLPSATLVVGMYGDDTSGILPGQYVCELHLVIHRMPEVSK